MKQPRSILLTAAAVAVGATTLLLPAQTRGQGDLLPPPNTLAPAPLPATAPAPRPVAVAAPAPETAAMAALVAEVADQQARIVENQRLIDEKLAVITENLRIARIYVSRAK